MSPSPGSDSLSFFDNPDLSGPNYAFEAALAAHGKHSIAGIDEAGRGPLAGPVVAAAVILDTDNIPCGLNDSKRLTKQRRGQLFIEITATARVAWSSATVAEIDAMNILQATFLAMGKAVAMLGKKPDACLIDGRDVPLALRHGGHAIIGGDARSLSIAAASIIAKVVRDAMMQQADNAWPGYGFGRHCGYGTPAHFAALQALGPCPLHRRSFAPVALECQMRGIA